jgi:glutathione S-transferase
VPHCLLELSGATFEPKMVKLHKGEQYEPAYQAINPRGQVPVLVDGDQAVTQIVAITLYLDEKFPQSGFLPASGIARAKALETLAWMNNSVHTTFTHVFMPQKFSPDKAVQADIKANATTAYKGLLGELQSLVAQATQAGHAWLGGAYIGALDAYALTLARWGTIAGIGPQDFPALWDYVHKVSENEAIAKVIARERLQLNLMASS